MQQSMRTTAWNRDLCELLSGGDHGVLGFPGSSAGKESACNAGDPGLIAGLESSLEEGIGFPTPVSLGFPGGSDGKESVCSVRDLGWIPGLGRSLGGGNGNPLQYSCLENSKDRGVWRAMGYSPWGHKESDTTKWLRTAHGVTSNLKRNTTLDKNFALK